ncbi:LOW QUALITY PROTEIN: acetylcholinesterase [Daphnia magna]|uniref:LOW QUALITY PROTEIN: acetylcholinesterase n=1 Tax=Daphnia magna TaxID=35525 RepID=UPI001E1BC33D|nr:LOW QUALITY PROTEIN: acetylcholinesterase [Daphnia magna]
MKSLLLPIIFLLAGYYVAEVSSQVILEVPGYGVLNGTIENSTYTERSFYAFRSVFYAEMPTPANRFLPPVPKAPYPMDEIQQTTNNNAGCPQPGAANEDCLSLNIFTPQLPFESDTLLPVMVWIHGGAFSLGHALEYLPNRYMEHDIVLVAIQYRLGPLGFLSFDTDDVPGNAAIFDQIEALRWVNKHIQYFGGDPSQITIAGQSAGSASISLLLLAPQARGLFRHAIGESGSVLAEWALDRDGRGKAASLKIAEMSGCPLEPYQDLLTCVQNVDAKTITQAYLDFAAEERFYGGLGFSGSNPVIQVAGAQRIIESDPRELYSSGNFANVPTMFGANKQEGTLVLGILYNDFLVPNNLTEDEEFLANDLVPLLLNALHIDDPTGELATQLTEKYLSTAVMGNFTSMIPGLTDMCSVLFLKGPTYETTQLVSQHNPDAFFYSFEYEGRNSIFSYLFAMQNANPPPIPHGVSHADELIYLFIYPFKSVPPGLNSSEIEHSMKMLQVWTNFVIFGNPTPDGVALLDGIPQFLRYNTVEESYTAIDDVWRTEADYTLTYTVTVDELTPPGERRTASKRQSGRFQRSLPEKNNYLGY